MASLLAFLVLLAAVMSVANYLFCLKEGDDHYYLLRSPDPEDKMSSEGFLLLVRTFFSVILLSSTVIPISLQIAIEIAKGFQAWFVSLD